MASISIVLAYLTNPGKAGNVYHSDSSSQCEKCKIARPIRSHHCRVCKRCVLKMDHHCPWIANCAGFYNYKYFFLFCLYAFISAGSYVLHFIIYWNARRRDLNPAIDQFPGFLWTCEYIVETGICSLTFLGTGTLVFTHLWQIVNNITTLEQLKGIGVFTESKFNVGRLNNFLQVMGPNPVLWFIPTGPNLDTEGLYFPTLPQQSSRLIVAKDILNQHPLDNSQKTQLV